MSRRLLRDSVCPRSSDLLAELRQIARSDPEDLALLDRWERLSLLVRCGLFPDDPNRIRLYVASGQRLISEGIGRPVPVHQRMLNTLMQTACDAALPMRWRYACAEHFDLPLARLMSSVRRIDPHACGPLAGEVERIRASLCAAVSVDSTGICR